MTLIRESPAEVVITGLKELKQTGFIPREVLKEYTSLIIPEWFFVAFPFLGYSYLGISVLHFLAKDMASAMAALGPMLAVFCINGFIKNKMK